MSDTSKSKLKDFVIAYINAETPKQKSEATDKLKTVIADKSQVIVSKIRKEFKK